MAWLCCQRQRQIRVRPPFEKEFPQEGSQGQELEPSSRPIANKNNMGHSNLVTCQSLVLTPAQDSPDESVGEETDVREFVHALVDPSGVLLPKGMS